MAAPQEVHYHQQHLGGPPPKAPKAEEACLHVLNDKNVRKKVDEVKKYVLGVHNKVGGGAAKKNPSQLQPGPPCLTRVADPQPGAICSRTGAYGTSKRCSSSTRSWMWAWAAISASSGRSCC